jgi:PKD repeat protein
MIKKYTASILFLFTSIICHSQETKRVLFIGNSYTAVNNLPQIVSAVANSTGDNLVFDMNAPGGQTLQGHSNDATSVNKIMSGNWDFVVLQEQSQIPAFPENYVNTNFYPFAATLNNIINTNNSCGETIFYMTWGRKNGDAQNCPTYPPICTYEGMDNLLSQRYVTAANQNHAIVSPVGAVWKYLRQNYPTIELYTADESHPSIAGSYAAACCFYTTIFRKDPTFINNDYTLLAADAANIREAVKVIVYNDLLTWNIGEYDPISNFNFSSNENVFSFNNLSTNSLNYLWDFGDGTTSNLENPSHTYNAVGIYNVSLTATACNYSNVVTVPLILNTLSTAQNDQDHLLVMYPNPVETVLNLNLGKLQTVLVIDLMGQNVTPKYYSEAENTKIDFTGFTPGIYLLKVINDNKISTYKIVKK